MSLSARIALALIGWGMIIAAASATTITVDTTSTDISDDGNCSIFEAVQAANTNLAVDECPAGQANETDDIFINLFGTINLASATELVVSEQLSIRGQSPGITRLSGGNQRKIFRIAMTDMTDDFTLSDLRLENARGASTDPLRAGGAVQLAQGGTFSFINVDFDSNIADFSPGGAIYAGPLTGNSNARLIIENSRFLANVSQTGAGAISGLGFGDVSALRSVSITSSEFRENRSVQSVSTLQLFGVENITIASSQFADNLSESDDGVVRILAATANTFSIVENTGFLNNSGRGIELDGGFASVVNSTFYNNDPQPNGTQGGGLRLTTDAAASVIYSTFFNNGDDTGSQIFICATCELSMRASIASSASRLVSDCVIDDIGSEAGIYISFGQNIDATASCATSTDDLPMTDPLLLPLDVYGPQFQRFALRTLPPRRSSPAVDIGPANSCPGPLGTSVNLDQRGFQKPTDGDDSGINECDSGSVEFQPGDDIEDFDLSVVFLGNGDGQVISSPPGIDCDANCSAVFLEGTLVTLMPTADPGSEFVGWSGACIGLGACKVAMDSSQTITASFVEVDQNRSITVTLGGNGAGTVTSMPAGINCPGACQAEFDQGQTVTLTAAADAGKIFQNWGGDCGGSDSCVITLDSDADVSAIFRDSDQIFIGRFQ